MSQPYKKVGQQLIPNDISAGRFTAAQLEAKRHARAAAHDNKITELHDPDRDIANKVQDSRSNHEVARGDSGRIDKRSDGTQSIRSNAIPKSEKVIQYPEAFSSNRWQVNQQGGAIVPDSSVDTVSKQGRGDRNLPALANSKTNLK